MTDFLHNDPEFKDLLAIVSAKEGVDATLIEKDYWIMHVLYGLQQLGIKFELKGGTSLSKGYGLIERFSEDIDIHIQTDFGLPIEGKEDKPKVREARKEFYDRLAKEIKIPGIINAVRDTEFDDLEKYRSGGIRLYYKSHTPILEGVKEGILLEVGFDTITPNRPVDISSWTLDHARTTSNSLDYIDNSAKGILCYHPGYTLVEKLQTIVNKYRKEIESDDKPKNFMRQYYDVYCLLKNPAVRNFIGSEDYQAHKVARFRGADKNPPLSEHPALLLSDKNIRNSFEARYRSTSKLYYRSQPSFENIIEEIHKHLERL
jgi:hypothetical protein